MTPASVLVGLREAGVVAAVEGTVRWLRASRGVVWHPFIGPLDPVVRGDVAQAIFCAIAQEVAP